MLDSAKLNDFRNRLFAMRARMDAVATELFESANENSGLSAAGATRLLTELEERASHQSQFDVDMALSENEAHLRAAIGAALNRLEDGSFGTCAECGAAISEERLNAVPYARRCIHCERSNEKEAAP